MAELFPSLPILLIVLNGTSYSFLTIRRIAGFFLSCNGVYLRQLPNSDFQR